MSLSFSEQLRLNAEPGWSGAVAHPFTVQLGDDTLADKVYLSWAQREAHKTPPTRFWLHEWIELHVLPEFEAFVAWLRAQLDSFADLGESARARLDARFSRMAWLEQAFFDVLLREQE
jgi:thiaminase/transcriptional activator TenA